MSAADSQVSPLAVPDSWADLAGPAREHRVDVPHGDLADGLAALAAEAGAPLRTVLLAAHLAVLGALTVEPAFLTWVSGGALTHTRGARTWRQLVARTLAERADARPLPVAPHAVRYLDNPDAHDGDRAGFALSVLAGDGRLELTTATDRLGRDHADRLAAMYRTVLAAMAADPHGDATISCLPAAERAGILAMGDTPPTAWPTATVPDLIEGHAAATPDAIAVTSGGERLTYRELDRRANRIAHRLRALGAGPDTLVACRLRRGPDLIPALLGILRSGAAYLPLDPSVPAGRLARILADHRVPILVTHAALTPKAYQGKLLVLDEDRAALADEPTTPPRACPADPFPAARGPGVLSRRCAHAPIQHRDGDADAPCERTPGSPLATEEIHGTRPPSTDPARLAYVIFTSGSTGAPKGVMVGHAALTNLLRSFREHTGTWLAATSVSFDISALEMFLPLSTGGHLVVATDEEVRDPAALLDLIGAHEVSHVQATPSGWRLLLAAGFDRPGCVALAGGEELPGQLAAELRGRVRRLVNVYGPTETTIWSSAWEVPAETAPVSLGSPLANTRLHVLDAAGHPAPLGVAGELHIGGDGLARGYLHRPDLTADRFVPDPHGPAGARLYRTGDLACRLPDGTLRFIGRVDTQVKIRGYRIELGEIEAALTAHPLVRDAVVVLREPTPGNKRLVAYLVPNGRVDVAALRARLGAVLPDYMIPATFVAIDRIPLNTSGKVDRGALPAPDVAGRRRKPAAAPARTRQAEPVKEPRA
ncbi:amino acid adenylation domain-containing protein [Solihabitans fulvus]|uniref:Amino acid adenylation domain-containing protein n=1 Tax=Solihabitans fulvus TaxID=1892852 RepID=A0A5B2X310_9PSEU|nr:amino acid adenylation domain-containing protein [Solihabitans fulvus]KAA2257565.1 amino acid adenylation domain-containing protein [Solihabitans fulvus]